MARRIFIIIFLFLFISLHSFEQTVVRTIQSFGAKGDGKTNDTYAFEQAAAFFNSRGGNGKLIIPKGIYIVGQQLLSNGVKGKPFYTGQDILHLKNIKNMTIAGKKGALLKCADSLRFGAFDPITGAPYDHGNNRFSNYLYTAAIGSCIYIENCDNIRISNIYMDGNSKALITGGIVGDVGIQVSHNGLFILNSHNITVDNINASYFGCDGFYVRNKPSNEPDNIKISNSVFEYNCRDGMSWLGGNGIVVENCSSRHSGKGRFHSSPAAGLDIEAEVGSATNGIFKNCEFTDNEGCNFVSDSGDDSDCYFSNCTFGGTNYAVWVKKPAFTFFKCTMYGTIVHGYDSPNEQDATRFIRCHIEDKIYNNDPLKHQYLIDTNGRARVTFEKCTIIANQARLFWMRSRKDVDHVPPEQNYRIYDCHFIVTGAAYAQHEHLAVMKGVTIKNTTFEFKDPTAKAKAYWLDGYDSTNIVDLGGNKIIYDK